MVQGQAVLIAFSGAFCPRLIDGEIRALGISVLSVKHRRRREQYKCLGGMAA